MIEINTTIPNMLSNACQDAYDKIKELIEMIFSLLKVHGNRNDLKEEFYNSYIDFARNLKLEGHDNECYNYMGICQMYYGLIDQPKVLIDHEDFFNDLFNAFDELLHVKLTNPGDYGQRYDEFLMYKSRMQEYYYRTLASPSPHYDEDACNMIIRCLSGDLDE